MGPAGSPAEDGRQLQRQPADPASRAAPVHSSHLIDVAISTSRFDEMRQFFEGVAGLTAAAERSEPARRPVFASAIGRPDLVLEEVPAGQSVGMRSFPFSLLEGIDFESALRRLSEFGVPAAISNDDDIGQAITIRDPDGFEIRSCAPSFAISAPTT